MDSQIPDSADTKIALLISAATVEEAEAVLKQILLELGYDSEIARQAPSRGSSSEKPSVIVPSASPTWQISLRSAGSQNAYEPPSRDRSAEIVCEIFGLVVARIEAEARIETLSESVRSAISTLHHDIRTPLTSIAGMAQTLRMRPTVGDDIRSEFLERMEASAETITAMTDEFRAGLDAMLTIAATPAEMVRIDEIFGRGIETMRSKGLDVAVVVAPKRPLYSRAPYSVIDTVIGDAIAHSASVLKDKVAAALSEEPPQKATESETARTARVIIKGIASFGYEIPADLSKTWVPQGVLIADDQSGKLSRPFHLVRALGGSLDVYAEGEEVVFEIVLPLCD